MYVIYSKPLKDRHQTILETAVIAVRLEYFSESGLCSHSASYKTLLIFSFTMQNNGCCNQATQVEILTMYSICYDEKSVLD